MNIILISQGWVFYCMNEMRIWYSAQFWTFWHWPLQIKHSKAYLALRNYTSFKFRGYENRWSSHGNLACVTSIFWGVFVEGPYPTSRLCTPDSKATSWALGNGAGSVKMLHHMYDKGCHEYGGQWIWWTRMQVLRSEGSYSGIRLMGFSISIIRRTW